MSLAPAHPAALVETLERMGLSDLLEGYIAPERVRRWGFLAVERFAASHGYAFAREHGNIYGKLHLTPAPTTPAPLMRLVTRSDVAAVYGSRPRAA
jgi:hypothetical protein